MKHHAHFRPLRSVIRAANNVITSRFLVKRIDRHRLLFRVVSPHNCGSKDVGREECGSYSKSVMSDMEAMKDLNRSLSEAVRLAVTSQLHPRPACSSQSSIQTASLPTKESACISTCVSPKSPPSMIRTTKSGEKLSGDDGKNNHPSHSSSSPSQPFVACVFRPVRDKNSSCHRPPLSLASQYPLLPRVRIVETGKDSSPSRVCDLPLHQYNKRKDKECADSPSNSPQLDDSTTVVSDAHRASTPVRGNMTPKNKKDSASVTDDRTTAGSVSARTQTQTLAPGIKSDMHNDNEIGSPPLIEKEKSEEGLRELVGIILCFWGKRDNSTGKNDGEGKNEDFINILLHPREKSEEKASTNPPQVTSDLPSLHPERVHHHCQHGHHGLRQHHPGEVAIQKSNASAMEELEALFETFRERRKRESEDANTVVDGSIGDKYSRKEIGQEKSTEDIFRKVERRCEDANDINVSRSAALTANTSSNTSVTTLSKTKIPHQSKDFHSPANTQKNENKSGEHFTSSKNVIPANNALGICEEFSSISLLPTRLISKHQQEKRDCTKIKGQKISQMSVIKEPVNESSSRTTSTKSDVIYNEKERMIRVIDFEGAPLSSPYETDDNVNIERHNVYSKTTTRYLRDSLGEGDDEIHGRGYILDALDEDNNEGSARWLAADEIKRESETAVFASNTGKIIQHLTTEKETTHVSSMQSNCTIQNNADQKKGREHCPHFSGNVKVRNTNENSIRRQQEEGNNVTKFNSPYNHHFAMTMKNMEHNMAESKNADDTMREPPRELRKNRAKQSLRNFDQRKHAADVHKGQSLVTMSGSESVQLCGDVIDSRSLQKQIFFLEGLKAQKEEVIDRKVDTQSVGARSFTSSVSSSHGIRTENKEDILRRNAGVAVLELEIQTLSQKLLYLRKKQKQNVHNISSSVGMPCCTIEEIMPS